MIDDLFGDHKEGYIYKPHNRIEIRAFSTFIEEGDSINTIGIPDYATLKYSASTQSIATGPIGNLPLTSQSNFYRWRDLLDIGYVDSDNRGVDYPFESGAHYINVVNRFYLERQDPPCSLMLNGLNLVVPENIATFQYIATLPTYLDYEFITPPDLSGGGDEANMDTLDDEEIIIRLVTPFGDYPLGPRSTVGGCPNLNIIETKDIYDDC
jgi:hypothetical protein